MSERNLQKENDVTFRGLFLPLTTKKAIIFIFLIGFVVFFYGIFNGFVGDDARQITENPTIQSLQNLSSFFSGSTFYGAEGIVLYGSFYKPLLVTSYSLLYSFFGTNAYGYHFFQILLYIINVCIVFLILKHFLKQQVAFLLSVIFLAHPINSEAAFYISAMQEVLFVFFGSVALLIIINSKNYRALVCSSLFLLLSLLSKETGILFCFISFIYIALFKRKYIFASIFSLILVFTFYMALRVHALSLSIPIPAIYPIEQLNLVGRLSNVPAIFFFYLKTFIFPINLAVTYQWVITDINLNNFYLPLFLDLSFFVAIFLYPFISFKKTQKRYITPYIFFISWFILGILLHLQLIPLDATVADRWFYFPMIGFLGMIGIFCETNKTIFGSNFAKVLIGILIILFSARTIIRSSDWRDYFTLAKHDIQISKESWSLENAMSYYYFVAGDLMGAKIHLERSIQLHPSSSNYQNLGIVYQTQENYKNAKQAYEASLKFGDDSITYKKLASLGLVYGDAKQNMDFISRVALKKYPKDAELWQDLAILEYLYGNKENAKIDISTAYSFTKSPLINYLYNSIIENKPLNLKFSNGQIIMPDN
jgi:protein O-mannosyl-transferase